MSSFFQKSPLGTQLGSKMDLSDFDLLNATQQIEEMVRQEVRDEELPDLGKYGNFR